MEHALAKADFLNVPDIVLVQALTIFLFLVRRHDSPRFVWMMTGLVIRMAQALGLQRDGSNFDHLTPYEVEIRRRVWWAVCLLDLRASEDQGTDLTTTSCAFDTKLPLNINDTDIDAHTIQTPSERQSVTDMTFTVVSFEICDVMRRLITPAVGEGSSGVEVQRRLLNEIYETLDRHYLQYSTETENITSWVAVTLTRLVIAKMTLIIHLPVLFCSPSEHLSEDIRTTLLVSAIEVAEYNHALNSEKACRHWRWLFQTCTHWHAIVYLLLEISRRPWSAIIERAWVALHSSWLIPVPSKTDTNLRIWFPLQKLMSKARKHRDTELERLRGDTRSAAQLEMGDMNIPLPASSGPFSGGRIDESFRDRWRELIAIPGEVGHRTQHGGRPTTGGFTPLIVGHVAGTTTRSLGYVPMYGKDDLWSNSHFDPADLASQGQANTNATLISAMATNSPNEVPPEKTGFSSNYVPAMIPSDWAGGQSIGRRIIPWVWAEVDPSVENVADMDINTNLDTEIDWYNWVESAKDLELNFGEAGDACS